jgi:hypothetical protein
VIKAVSQLSQDLMVGQLWRIEISMDGTDTPVLEIVLPDGSTLAPAVIFSASSEYPYPVWLAEHAVTVAGRHIGVVTTAEDSSLAFQAWVAAVTANTGLPDITDVDNYLGGAGSHSWSDDDLTQALAAEAANQRRVCDIPAAYPDDLREALIRRAARNLDMRRRLTAQPSEGGDFDVPVLNPPGRDTEIRKYEAPWRKLGVG